MNVCCEIRHVCLADREATDPSSIRPGPVDVAWGDIHRVRLGDLDLPVGGCSGFLGCFRVLWYDDAPDGKQRVAGGDGWVLVVEFGRDGPCAYSVLAYGESAKPDSPHHTDQAEMFTRGELKRVALPRRRSRPSSFDPTARGGGGNDHLISSWAYPAVSVRTISPMRAR